MKNKAVYRYIGKVILTFSSLLIIPIIVALIYKENPLPFISTMLVSIILGLLLVLIFNKNDTIYAKEGFIIVTLSWIVISIISSIPFVLSAKLSFSNAIFESVSGLSTTGATIFDNVEVLDKSLLFWRSFTHFIGGMGVLAFVMTIIPLSKEDKSMHLLRAEMPGPEVGKLVPSIKKTLLLLYGIYIGLTFTEFILLLIGKTPVFDSILISVGTAGTGGFALLNSSLATYTTFSKYVVSIFMLLFGVNFNIYFLIIMKDFKSAFKSEELKIYIGVYIFSVLLVIINTYHYFISLNDTILNSMFHVSSFITSTGYSIGDVNIYPTNTRIVMMLLMLTSACAGSTCGGFKLSRLIIIIKKIKRDLLKLIHPNLVSDIRFEGKKVDEKVIESTTSFLFLYIILIIIIMFIVSLDPLRLTFSQTINATFTTFANVGLCFEIPNFAMFSPFSKIVLSIGMLLGRLEIFPVIALFTNINNVL